jgi:hypothetical protein
MGFCSREERLVSTLNVTKSSGLTTQEQSGTFGESLDGKLLTG